MNIEIANIFNVHEAAALFDQYRVFYGKQSDLEAAQRFLSERLVHQQSVILLARDEFGASVGFTQLYPTYSSVSMRKKFILNDLFVSPQGRGKGVGAALLEQAKLVAREYGAVALALSTAVTNESAQQLYKSNGWELETDFLSFNFSL
jgi:GNAT superfamily N-acetyltransferase